MDFLLVFAAGLALGIGLAVIFFRSLRAQARDSFQALSAEALRANNQVFLDLAKSVLAREQESARGDLEKRALKVNEALKPLDEKLGQMHVHNQELEKARLAAYEGLKQHLGGLVEAQQQLKQETSQLKLALRRPEGRGRWGEVQLRRVLEMAGMLPHCDFVEQSTETGEEGRLRPDVIVQIPEGRRLVIDCKTPLDGFLDIAETEDEDARLQLVARHARKMREHVKSLGTKAYWQQFASSPDYVVMFVPGEHFLSLALQKDPEIFDFAFHNRVVIATPLNLIALLRTIAQAWNQQKIADEAHRVAALGRKLYEGLASLASPLQSLGDSLRKSVDHYNKTATAFEKRALNPARRLKDQYGVESGKEIEVLEALEAIPLPVSVAQMSEEPEEEASGSREKQA